MKREQIVHIAITKDEMRDLISKMKSKEDEDGRRYTTSSFLREFAIKPLLNGSSSPPQKTVIETVIETHPDKTDNRWDNLKL